MRPDRPAVVKPVRKSVMASVAAVGTIYSGRAFAVTAPQDGQIARFQVRPGQLVREGDPLFIVDTTPLRRQIHAQEEAIRELRAERRGLQTHAAAPEFREARRELARARRHLAALQRRGRATDADFWNVQDATDRYLEMRAGVWQRQAELREAEREARRDLALLYARLPSFRRRSPVAGLVTEIHASPHQEVMRGFPVLRIEDPRHVTVRALVDEENSARIHVGQPVRIETPASHRSFAGKVTRVTPGTDHQLWQSWVTIKATGTPAPFRNGQPVRARIVTAAFRNAIVLPHSVVRNWRTGAVVYVAHGSRIEERLVKAVRVDTGEMAILAGLEPGEVVVPCPRTPAKEAPAVAHAAPAAGRSAYPVVALR
jgi:HlyD family secretion protein